MGLEWNSAWETGIDWMDAQHKELFVRIFSLLDGVLEGKEKEEVDGLIAFLGDYVYVHFGAEERAMIASEYPGYSAHKEQHEAFKASFAVIRKDVQEQGILPHLTIRLQKSLVDWLMDHIGRVDKKLAKALLADSKTASV